MERAGAGRLEILQGRQRLRDFYAGEGRSVKGAAL